MSALDREHLQRALKWTDEPIDRETARWASSFAEDVLAYVTRNRARMAFRAPEIAKVLSRYVGLPDVMDTVERLTGARFH